MKILHLIPAAAAAACLFFAASCSDYVGKETTHPLYAKAMNAKSAKSYQEAADGLEEFLTICPKSPAAHYEAAQIYKENLAKYPAAIYHLQKYLELSGPAISNEDAAGIRRYIAMCEQMMFNQYRQNNGIKLADEMPQADPAKLAAKNAEITALRTKIQKYIDNEKVILAQNQELKTRLSRAGTTTPAARPGAAAPAAASSRPGTAAIPSSTTGTPGTTINGENGVRYYYVAKGDGLQAIAQKMYGKSTQWKLIQEANKATLGERGILKIGQKLVIPPLTAAPAAPAASAAAPR